MGNPGRRRRSGQHRWVQALIDRAPGSRGRRREAALNRLLAEPDEDDWPGHTAAERPLDDPADGWPADPAAYQWLGGWTDEPAPRRLLDGASEPGWPADAPATGEPAGMALFAGYGDDPPGPGPGGRRRGRARPGWLGRVTQQDWYLALARYRWYLAVSAGAGAMALVSGVILLLPHQSGRAMMADARPVTGASGSRPSSAAPSQPAASPVPDVSAQPATPAPGASMAMPTMAATVPVATTPASAAPGFVTVTYRLVEFWSGGIIGKYTITNHSNAVLSGWQFTATFPGDQVQFVIGAVSDPDPGSDVLVLEPASAGAQLAPGGRVSVIFYAAGPTGSPVACSFNGTAC
jgi:cellulose binding protein with CBM2 domain